MYFVTYDIEESNISDSCNVVGVDRGINFVVATYDSKHKSGFVSGKAIKQKRAHYSKLRKELQMRRTPPANLSGIRSATERVKTKDRYVSVSWSFYDLEHKPVQIFYQILQPWYHRHKEIPVERVKYSE